MREAQVPKVDTRVVVETPEGVDFRFVIAGPGKRGPAFATDMLLKIAITLGLGFSVSALSLFGNIGGGLAAGLFLLTLFFVNWFYGGLFEGLWQGRTPGKKMAGLRVVRTNGTPISLMNALGRNFLTAADCLPAVAFFGTWTVGLLAMFAGRRLQRLGDLVFDTMVIDESREWASRAPGITSGVEAIPRSECPGRYSVPERTLAIIERLFENDRLISEGRREEIARPVSLALRRRLGWEETGPDPRNPHIYFTHVPNRHTTFLRRVLKTFADNPGTREENSRTLASAASGRFRPSAGTFSAGTGLRSQAGFRGTDGTLDAMSVDWSLPAGLSPTQDSSSLHPQPANEGSDAR